VKDKEVIAPPIVVGSGELRPESGGKQRELWSMTWLRALVSAAACLIAVILVGRLTGTQVSVSGSEFRLSFGGSGFKSQPVEVPAQPAGLTEAEVRNMIASSIEQNNGEIRKTLEESQRKLDASIRANLAMSSDKVDRLVREAATASQEQIRTYVDGIRAENLQQVKDYFQLSSTEQKKYIENLLVDFAKYLQQQRNDDLRLVQMRMNNIEQNTDLFKQETEQILSSIITTVGVPVSNETTN
jgi:hypothetical protein